MIKVFSVYDSKVGAFANPFFAKSNGEAVRMFSDAVNDSTTSLNKHPGDFTLFGIADFDEETGRLEPYDVNLNLGLAITFLPDMPANPGFKTVSSK